MPCHPLYMGRRSNRTNNPTAVPATQPSTKGRPEHSLGPQASYLAQRQQRPAAPRTQTSARRPAPPAAPPGPPQRPGGRGMKGRAGRKTGQSRGMMTCGWRWSGWQAATGAMRGVPQQTARTALRHSPIHAVVQAAKQPRQLQLSAAASLAHLHFSLNRTPPPPPTTHTHTSKERSKAYMVLRRSSGTSSANRAELLHPAQLHH